MNVLIIIAISLYIMFIGFSTVAFSHWLHETKAEFKNSWISSIMLGFVLSIVWPISMFMLYVSEKNNEKKI